MGGPLDKDAILLQVSRSYASKQNDRKILKNIGRCAAAARLLESISDCCDCTCMQLALLCESKGHWLFIGAVSWRWRILLQQLQFGTGDNKASREYMTWYGAAVASVTCLDYALEHGLSIEDCAKDDGSNAFCLGAGRSADIDVLLHAHELGMPWHQDICAGAAERGRLSILQWLRTSVQCPWDAAAVGRTAAQNGDLPLLNWLSNEEANGRWKDGDGVCAAAAFGRHVDVLEWMQKEGLLWDEKLCQHAAGYNQMAALQWCREQGYGWNEDACTAAAVGGHCSMVQYLHQQVQSDIRYSCYMAAAAATATAANANACDY
eukprot:18283-Heterococcus_DN1.PRE.1